VGLSPAEHRAESRSWWSLLTVVAVVACGLCAGHPAWGQAAGSDVQRRLNAEGLAALEGGDYARAARRFRAALDEGELDLLYYNLGRALQKGGACAEAAEALDKALTAPVLGTPPHEDVVKAVETSRAELEQTCDGVLVVACDPPDLKLTVDGAPMECDTELTVPPGDRTVVGTHGGTSVDAVVAVRGLHRSEARLEVVVASTAAPVEGAPSDAGWRPATAWTLLGLGAVGVVGGLFFSFLTNQTLGDLDALAADRRASDFDTKKADALDSDLDAYKTGQVWTYGAGAVLGAAALVLFLWDMDEPGQARLLPWADPSGTGLVLEGSF
jgi:hypothetical protein